MEAAFPLGAVLILAGLPVGAVSLLLRFRRARGLERLQLRWVAVGGVLAAVALVVSLIALVVESGDGPVFQTALGVSILILPLATGAAILRYRLYDLDRIVSRTLAYGLLAVAEETMHPTKASLWLRPQPSSSNTGGRLARR